MPWLFVYQFRSSCTSTSTTHYPTCSHRPHESSTPQRSSFSKQAQKIKPCQVLQQNEAILPTPVNALFVNTRAHLFKLYGRRLITPKATSTIHTSQDPSEDFRIKMHSYEEVSCSIMLSTSAAKRNMKKPCFYDLPSEIKNLVYEFALTGPLDKNAGRTNLPFLEETVPRIPLDEGGLGIRLIETGKFRIKIPRLCSASRMFQRHCYLMYFSLNTFFVSIPDLSYPLSRPPQFALPAWTPQYASCMDQGDRHQCAD